MQVQNLKYLKSFEPHYTPHFKRICIPKCGKCLLVESGIYLVLTVKSRILGFGIPNTAQRIRNPVPEILNPQHGILHFLTWRDC